MAFRGLQAESVAQGETHKTIAKELHTLVADPFQEWAQGYKVNIRSMCAFMVIADMVLYRSASNKARRLCLILGCVLMSYLKERCAFRFVTCHTRLISCQVAKLRNQYLTKIRRADEAEDE